MQGTPGTPLLLTDAKLLQNQLASVQAQAQDIHQLIHEEQLERLRHWEQEEKGELEQMISSLLESQDILKKDKKSIKAAYHTTFTIAAQQQAAYVKAAAEQYKRAHPTADVVDLQTKLVDLNNRLLDIDLDIKVVNRDLSQAFKRDEQELHSTRLVVMQDTQRILQSEIDSLRSSIFNIETAAKLEAEKRSAEDTGFAALFRVEEQLAKIAGRIDRAKQQILFPEAKGYQFSTGDAGVYIGCHDLFLSEVSGRFEVRCRRVTKPDGNYAASLFISFGGVSCTSNSAEARMTARPGSTEKEAAGSSHARNMRKSVCQASISTNPLTASDAAATSSPKSTLVPAAPPLPPFPSINTPDAAHHARTGSTSSAYNPPHPSSASPVGPHAPQHHSTCSMHPHAPQHLQHGQQPPAPRASLPSASRTPVSGGSPAPGLKSYQSLANHTHTSSKDSHTGLVGLSGLTTGGSQLLPLPGRSNKHEIHPKGEMVASFLSGLSRKKEKYKKKVEQDLVGSPRSSKNLGDRIEHKFTKFGESMRDGMGLGSKGKLSKLGKLIAIKAPKSSPRRTDSKFGEDIPSKYYHVSDERSEGSAGDADLQHLHNETLQASKNPDMLESYLSASAAAAAAAAAYPPEEDAQPPQDDIPPIDSPQSEPHQVFYPSQHKHHRSASVSSEFHQQQQQQQQQRRGQSSTGQPLARKHSDSPQVSGDTEQGAPESSHQASHGPALPKRKSKHSKAERKAEEGMSVAFEEFEDQPARNGVYCQVLGEQVEVIGEKGTKVPDINVKELMLEIELVANTLLEWTPAEGWKEGRPVSLKVLQLEHKMRGSLMHLPQSAIKGLLHLFLPSYLGKTIVASLPPELGQYVVEANEDVHLSGEFRLFGQALGTYMADVLTPVANEALSKKKQQQQQQAAARSRGLLGLTEAQAQAVHKLFSVLSSIMPNGGVAAANKENKSGPVGSTASICQLCRFYSTYSTSRYWAPLCAIWNRAFQAALLYYGAPEEERFSFSHFMDVRVARLVRKPVRVSFMIDRLKMGVDVDAALNALKELFARLAKDYHRRSLGHPSLHGVDGPIAPREPLEVQLENLELWHASMLAGLRSFKSRFRSASCTLMAMADRDEFQFGAENAIYDGPLHFSVPMNFTLDPDNSFVMDVKLPDQKATMNSVTAIIQDMLFDLSSSAVQQKQQQGGSSSGEDSPVHTEGGEAAALVQKWQEMVALADPKAAAAAAMAIAKLAGGDCALDGSMAASVAAATMAATGSSNGGEKNIRGDVAATHLVLKNPVVGQLLARRMNFALKLDEERLAALLASNPQAAHEGKLLGLLMACYGDLFNAALDVGWGDADPNMLVSGGLKPQCMLNMANNKVTRATATVDSLMFQSIVSPGKAIKMIEQIVIPAMLRFYPRDSSQLRWWTKVFEQLYEYFSKDALDALMCVSARAEVVRHPEPKPSSKLQAARQQALRQQAQHKQQQPHPEEVTIEGSESWVAGSKLRVILAGGSSLAEEVPNGNSTAAAQAQGTPNVLGQVAPIYIVNDVNLLTLMDTVKLLMEASSG